MDEKGTNHVSAKSSALVQFAWMSTLAGLVVFAFAVLAVQIGRPWIVAHARGFIASELEERARSRDFTLADGFFTFRITTPDTPEIPEAASPNQEDAPTEDAAAQRSRMRVQQHAQRIRELVAQNEVKEQEPELEEAAAPSLLDEARRRTESLTEASGYADVIRQREAQLVAQLEDFVNANMDQIIRGMVERYRQDVPEADRHPIVDILIGLLDAAPPEVPRELAIAMINRAAEENREHLDRWEGEVRGDYTELTDALVAELRLFTIVNATLFLVLFGSLHVYRDRAHLFAAPAMILVLATLLSILSYLLLQDWSSAVLEGRYWGWYTFVYTGIFALFLADILYNKGEVTIAVLDGMLQALSALAKALSSFSG